MTTAAVHCELGRRGREDTFLMSVGCICHNHNGWLVAQVKYAKLVWGSRSNIRHTSLLPYGEKTCWLKPSGVKFVNKG